MPEDDTHDKQPSAPLIYEIRVERHLADKWTDWFGGVSLRTEADGSTLLTCKVIDQAALHGLLRQIRDLGMPLISVNRIDL